MASPDGHRSRPGRPRNHELDDLIRAATIELLAQDGEAAAALDAVAAQAGVGKATIYRRWATKRELIADAVAAHLPIEFSAADGGSLDAGARALLDDLVALLGTPHALAGRQLLAQLSSWPELAHAYRDGALAPWQAAVRSVATAAHARGEISDPAPAQLALQAAAARICLQWLVDPATVIGDDIGGGSPRVVDLVATLIAPLPRS